jgi:hypothetical protein
LSRTRTGLIAAAFLGPFSATHLVGPLTVGRAAALALAAALGADLLRERPQRFRLDVPALLLVAGYVGLSVWIFLNSVAWGCNCEGKAAGFYEFAMIGVLAVVAVSIEPRMRGPAIVAALCGLVLAAALALSGVGPLDSGTVDLTATGGRLSGTFGNANELGLAAAIGIPIALSYRSARGLGTRIAVVISLLILATTLLLTYSRGGIVAAGVGVLALAFWEARGSRRRVAVVLGIAATIGLAGAVLYSAFENHREGASFESVPASLSELSQRDLSGWDSRALGPIPSGPSTLQNSEQGIAVDADRAGEGASFRWGEARRGGAYTLHFRAKADKAALPFSIGLGDAAQRTAFGARVNTRLGTHWRRISLSWRPGLRSPHATLYLWQRRGPSRFSFADIELVAHDPGQAPRRVPLPQHLEGSLYKRLRSNASRLENRYVRSRLDAAHLALRAFRSEPLRGIGWATFPAYSADHLSYGRLAAHDEYLAFAAELGIIGLALLGALVAAAALGVRRLSHGRAPDAAVGVLAAAAAGIVFIEALPAPQMSIPIAVALAIACGNQRPEVSATTSAPPLSDAPDSS